MDATTDACQFLNSAHAGVSSDESEIIAATAVAAIQQYEKAISKATENGDGETLALLSLVDTQKQSDAEGTCALCFASYNGNTDKVKMLLSHSCVDPTADDNAAVQLACMAGHIDITKLLLSDARVNPGAKVNLAFRLVSKYGHMELVQRLLEDPRVNPAAHNNYAIRAACVKGHYKIVKLLLSDSCVDPSPRTTLQCV
jgi:ankyrin repeat protein